MKVKQQNGLTLIEVLVVVAILAFLMLAIFKVFNTDVNRANDAKRKDDLHNIKLAFEDYYNDNQTYPPGEYLSDCDGKSLSPYLKSVPCDPTTGQPYLYLPFPGNGDNSGGYRVLSILEDGTDPIIEELGCQDGCGLPVDNPEFARSKKYVYGIAEGISLTMYKPTEAEIVEHCANNVCFCCANSARNHSQDCNVWTANGHNNCDMGPYETVADCYADTPCAAQ